MILNHIKRLPPLHLSVRFKAETSHWAILKNRVLPSESAMQHFDNFYGKVYGENWKSSRIALLTPHKYCAVVNLFGDNEETESELRLLGAIELGPYYQRHSKKYEKYKLRVKLNEEKKAKKRAMLEANPNSELGEIADDFTVSDVSDNELRRRGLGSSGSEAEDLPEMMQTDFEKESGKHFINQAGINLNLNDFVPATELRHQEEVISDTSYYNFYQAEVEVPVKFFEEPKLEFPEVLKVFTFPRGSLHDFPKPKGCKGLNILNYYLMDGASILPVLALRLQPKDKVADLCAAPGGKALAIALTLRPQSLLCNEKSLSRLTRLRHVFDSYIPKLKNLDGMVEIKLGDALNIDSYNTFDKILLDAPCTNDRHSVNNNDNNMFKSARIKERMAVPHDQQALLVNAIKLLKPGGSVVYSTCSLSPIQNDGVVHMALREIYDSTPIECAINDMKEAFRPLRGLYRLHRSFKYGQQIVPFLPCNFGPMYISKITRTK